MSAPDTNLPKEAKRHRPALIGIAAAVIFGLVVFMAIGFEATDTTDDPSADAPVMMDGPASDPAGNVPLGDSPTVTAPGN